MRRKYLVAVAAVAVAAAVGLTAPLASASATRAAVAHTDSWTGAWGAAQQHPRPNPWRPNWSAEGFSGESLRQVVRLSAGGSMVRIRLSNVYGSAPLRLTGATVAKTDAGAAIQAGTVRPLTFGQRSDATIPAGGEATSDAAVLSVAPLESLTITLYLAEATGPATFHADGFTTTYRAPGDHRFDHGPEAFGGVTSGSWYFLTALDVAGPAGSAPDGRAGSAPEGAVVVFGDSITDGYGSVPDTNNRYPDELAERLAASGIRLGVINSGISGNRLLSDSRCVGESGLARFARDVLAQARVRTVIVELGANDIGQSGSDEIADCGRPPVVTAADVIEGHRTLIRLAHARGVRAIGATIAPMKGSGYYSAEHEAIRDAVNEWMRTSGEYDGVVDFDAALRNPADPDAMLPAYDFGDHLHPNDAGRAALAAAVDLELL